MQKIVLNNTKLLIIVSLCLFILGGQPVKFAKDKTFFHGFLISKPIIKIGLGVNLGDVRITSSSGMTIYEINSSYRLIAENADEALVKGRKEKLTEKYVIQVARFKDREEAEIFAQDLKTQISNKIHVTAAEEEVLAGTYQVIVGDFMTRGDALGFIKTLNRLGIEDVWILREEITAEDSKPLWILVNDELKSLHDETVLYFVPSSHQSFLSYGNRDYEGIFVLRASRRGIILINILNVEDYLKGVVPSELSPYDFSELEAHKAQAVAARTYAIKNLGSNGDLGYDICDTPNTQFYQGMGAEHTLSTEAVEQTRGEVALHRGKLIDALYTSTCGGMTENVEEIFGGPALSYLRSTECTYDRQREWLLEGNNTIHPVFINGRNTAPSVASLINLKVIHLESGIPLFNKPPQFDEALSWIRNTARLLGVKHDVSLPEPCQLDHRSLASLMISAFGWEEKADSLLLEKEMDFLLQELGGMDQESRRHMACLIQDGIFPPAEEMGDTGRLLLRGELALYLWKAIESHPGLIRYGVFKSLNNDMMTWDEQGEENKSVLSSSLYLLRQSEDGRSIAEKILFVGGENIRLIEKEGNIHWLELINSPLSNTLDRSSIYNTWKVRKSKVKLEKRINRFYPVGELKDLIPQRKGNSNRIVELLIEGTDGRTVVKGLRIRSVLGLKETLFVINKEYDESGNITHFTFSGRGWGHGVGLCQIGAFGMARAGADYKQILKKYYKDIKISKIY